MNEQAQVESCCCGQKPADAPATPAGGDVSWIVGSADTPTGPVPRVSTTLHLADRLGAWKARWAIGRMRYAVAPGLYAAGHPTAEAPVLVTANYKMSFDRVRSQLAGIDAWILVLDTRAINVWCAAGKGTFSTEEIVRRLEAVRLGEVVSGRTLIVPQLGAPGVAAHEVHKQSGFRVKYGPVRAGDLPAFLDARMTATPEMRQVRFPLRDRLAVTPVEMVMAGKWALLIAVCFLVLAGLGRDGFSWARLGGVGLRSAGLFLAAAFGGLALTPALLPWLPGKAFSLKGAFLGGLLALAVAGLAWPHAELLGGPLSLAAWCLLIPVVASFLAMNFTGASTYTSLSGVRREMRAAVPVQALGAVAGTVLWLVGRFV